MSEHLQVVMSDQELAEIRAAAAREGLTVCEWARQALRGARLRHSEADPERKIAAIRAAARHQFPVSDVETVLAEIEQGYQAGRCWSTRTSPVRELSADTPGGSRCLFPTATSVTFRQQSGRPGR